MTAPKRVGAIFNVNFNIVFKTITCASVGEQKNFDNITTHGTNVGKKMQCLHHNAGQSLNDSMIHQFKIFSAFKHQVTAKRMFRHYSFMAQSVLQQVHNLLHSTGCDLVLPLPNLSTFTFP